MLRLRSLGQAIIEANESIVTPSAEAIFATSLYLIMEAGRPVGREELTRLVWPSVSEGQAQHGLRQVLYKLKSYGATIKADRSSLILSPRFCSTDFAELLEPRPNSILEALAEKVGGSFLPGYRPELSDQFAVWVERQRDIVHSAAARALVAGMQAKKRVSDWTGAEQLASMCLTIDPLNEEATLTVAEAAALGGSKAKALSILNNYLKEIGDDASEIKLPAALLRRRISEAYQENIFPIRDAPFVGREEEMAELTRALARAQKGNGSAYVITGEPGIGKTRLVQEFTRVASLQRVHIVRVGCQSHDVRRPLSAFVDMVPKLLALPGALGCSPESMGYLKKLTALEQETPSAEHSIKSTEGIFEHVRAALLDLVDALTGEFCLIVHIEDSQWMDDYSRALHESLIAKVQVQRLLILTSLTQASPDLSLNSSPRSLTLHLKPLSRVTSAILVGSMLSNRRATSQRFREWCAVTGCGNPFFITELAGYASDDGSFTAPPSLTNLIDARLASLSTLSQRVLQASGILGRHSQLELLEVVLGERRILLLESLDELAKGGFVDVDSQDIVSRHALITQAALGRASIASKTLLHLHAANALQAKAQENATILWDCAEHWRQAGERSRAIDLMSSCARHSLELGLPLEAASMLEAAADLSGDARQIELLRDCTTAYKVAGEWREAIRLADRTLNAIKMAPNSLALLPEAELEKLVTLARSTGLSRDELRKLLLLLRSSDARISTRIQAAIVIMMTADNKQDKNLANEVYSTVNEISPTTQTEWAHHHHLLLIYFCSFGDSKRALASIEFLITFARSTTDHYFRAAYLEHIGHGYRVNGAIELARQLYLEAFETAEHNYLYQRAEAAANSMLGLALLEGDYESARKWCDLSKEQSKRSRRRSAMEESMSYEAELCIREGTFVQARSLIESLREYSIRLDSVRAHSRQLALEADLKLSSGQALSERECRTLRSLYPKVAHAFRLDYFVAQLARGLISLGRSNEASCVLDQYVRCDRLTYEPLSQDLEKIRSVPGLHWPTE